MRTCPCRGLAQSVSSLGGTRRRVEGFALCLLVSSWDIRLLLPVGSDSHRHPAASRPGPPACQPRVPARSRLCEERVSPFVTVPLSAPPLRRAPAQGLTPHSRWNVLQSRSVRVPLATPGPQRSLSLISSHGLYPHSDVRRGVRDVQCPLGPLLPRPCLAGTSQDAHN